MRIREADDLRRLHAEVPELPLAEAVRATFEESGLLARVDAEHALVYGDRLQSMAEPEATTIGWPDAYRAMLDYAKAKGWYDDSTGTVQVHLQHTADGA
ncbi:hypothetical protein A3K89_17155 [Rhodococcoides kyotonense]|uniref:Uncharacterized protein n=1 Tax=Rhodococcoides kyotonense TaxID=398843 RepID=A0A177YME7_9NOCA|nr:hypothetical protein A3K89_17155 [Rhodococcus kyotonensis]